MSLPTEAECLKFMSDSKNAINDPDYGTWFIGGVEYPLERALLLAEYCLLCGTPLTSLATIEAALNQARRVRTLEDKLAALRHEFDVLDSYNLPKSQHVHWWHRWSRQERLRRG